jgi:hypothetical protein
MVISGQALVTRETAISRPPDAHTLANLEPLASSPRATTVPTASCPGTNGNFDMLHSLSSIEISERQIPQ